MMGTSTPVLPSERCGSAIVLTPFRYVVRTSNAVVHTSEQVIYLEAARCPVAVCSLALNYTLRRKHLRVLLHWVFVPWYVHDHVGHKAFVLDAGAICPLEGGRGQAQARAVGQIV